MPALEAAIGITYVVADLTMNDPMVGAMLKLTHQIGDYRGASGENITKTWGETQILLAERAIAQGDLKPDLDPETIGLLLQEMTAGVHITAVGTESIDQMAVRMERMWYFLLPSIVPDEKVAYFREFAARRLRRYVP
ncbi:TetR/AcrR family transcriptional regulator [Nocardia sp. NRRL WC-3656]|uniref:TetR/AcrR family transcriptional regulator n=1 Tax=Nocardia sp. NRRL WC-3656 TaxID=1463824 RepID=UPI000AD38B94|nr:TetR/AcrR family transcriptional regulator [Nocardia sp. NRRL WC-3656]